MRYIDSVDSLSSVNIKDDMPDMDDVIEALNELDISLTECTGESRKLMFLLHDVMERWNHTCNPRASRQLGDIAQSLIVALKALKESYGTEYKDVRLSMVVGNDDASLDAFLCEFKIHN